MVLIEWRDEFSVGVPAVDAEHRELIDLINETWAQAELNPADDRIEQFLGEIYARISAHFALEERIMEDARYDQFREHKSEHERLLDEIRDIMDDFESGVMTGMDELARRLDDWFTIHFATHDARLHRHLG